MDSIVFVTDRGSNFVRGVRQFKVVHYVAHRLNNVLKRTFYQLPSRSGKNDTPNKPLSKIIAESQVTPIKFGKKTTTGASISSSPEFDLPYADEKDDHSETNSGDEISDDDDDDDQCFLVDYTVVTVENLPSSAKHVLQMIKDCKALVAYVKKVSLNCWINK